MAQAHRIGLAGAAENGDPRFSRTANRSGFVLLDALCTNASASGLHRLAAAPHVARAALQHLARRLRAQGRPVLYGERTPARPAFADLLERNGLGPATDARSVLRALDAHRHCVVLLSGIDRDSWDATVLDELEADLVVVSGTHECRSAETIALQETLTPEGRALWLDGMCAELEASAPADLASLDSWLARTVHVARAASLGDHHQCAAGALATLAAVGRPLPRAVVEQYLGQDTASECLAHGVREDESGLFFSSPSTPDAEASRRAADLLQHIFPADSWALTRAACLHLQHGNAAAALAAFQSALSAAHDPAARREVLAVIDTNLAAVPEPGRAAFVLEAVARALELSESAFALHWLRSVTPDQCADRAQRALLQGRALYATGDMVAAKIALDEARTQDDGHLGPAIAAELAELACARGDHALARAEADAVRTSPRASLELQLRASNVTGKILLARSEWAEADRHFAEDALLAANHGLGTAEMRADLNRGIALLSRGRIDDADRQFVRVLAAADSRQDELAAAYALPNLAVAAVRKHEYGRALELWERAARTLQRLQARLPALRAMVSTNLAEMRIRLGLLDQAAHVIAFARRGAGTSELPSVSTWLDITEATLYLRRGDTSTARRLATHGLVEANRVGERHRAHLALRTLARIALEDGDVQTAEHLIEVECAAADATPSEAGIAEISVLRAALARAEGRDDALDLAESCLQPLREAGDEELLIEGLTLVALGYRDRGQEGLARESALRAAMVRDRVAETLQGETRGSYLAKRENTAVQRLLGSLDSPAAAPAPSMPGSRIRHQAQPGMARALCGEAPQISALLASIRKVAKSTATVLVRGESGTGKELVAAALHAQSDRASGPLVTVNCSALVETLLLSELFGHEKGSFTGAAARRRGRFELAEGGTLFLDEIGDISPRTQVALLRVLQERTFERVGGTTSIQANVRVVCATHRNLIAMVERGEFREDLYYRLCGVVLEVPALRNRLGDLPELARHLLERVALERGEPVHTLSRDALELMARHKWPGNVRELENVLRSLVLFAEVNVIASSDLVTNHECFAELASQRRSLSPASLAALAPANPLDCCGDAASLDAGSKPGHVGLVGLVAAEVPSSQLAFDEDDDGPMSSIALPASLGAEDPSSATVAAYAHVRRGKVSLFDLKRQIERDCILLALKETGGNITHAAALLSMKRPRLSQLVKQYQLQSEESS